MQNGEVQPRRSKPRRDRLLALPVSMLIGGLLALGHFRQGEANRAVVALLLFPLMGAFLAFSKSHIATASTEEGDERERMIQREAATYAYYTLIWVGVSGFIWETYTKEPGEPPGVFTLMSVVGGVSYAVSLFFLRRRR